MTTLPDIPTANFLTATNMLRVAALANQTVLMIGDPGVGKSSIVAKVAKDFGLPMHVLLGSTLDPTDIGGLPVKHTDRDGRALVERVPLKAIRDAADAACVLFLDEISAAPGAVQAAFLRLILDRVAGDVTLHPDTIVFAACNPPDQAPAGFELSAPLMGRMSVVRFRPTEDEVIEYLRMLGSDQESASDMDKALRDEAMLFAAVANATPELLQIDIPKSCVGGGVPWASPRSWEKAIRLRAAATIADMDPLDDAVYTLMAGAIGSRAAQTYNGVIKMITELPSVEAICADPEACLCPSDKSKQVAALGLMPRIAQKNLWAAYIYALRLNREFSLAAHKALMVFAKFQPAISDPLTKKGIEARAKLTAMIGGAPAKKS